jgi:hypothetical protein
LQISEGFDAAHDDDHWAGEIVSAPEWGVIARLCRLPSGDGAARRLALSTAAAMLVAEIERVDRAMNRRSGMEDK